MPIYTLYKGFASVQLNKELMDEFKHTEHQKTKTRQG